MRSRDGEPCAERFKSIRHNIGRLNHTMKATRVIISASHSLQYLFSDIKVIRVKSSCKLPPPLAQRKPSLDEIAGRMLSDPEQIKKYRDTLGELDQKFALTEKLHNQCTSTNWRPRVHAELILLDFFWTQNLNFVGGDKYIGCSKAACYSCYLYIQAHPGSFVPPACHNNIWLNWRPPDILDPNHEKLIKTREKFSMK